MNEVSKCAVCRNVLGGECVYNYETEPNTLGGGNVGFDCTICGSHEITHNAFNGGLTLQNDWLTNVERAVLSHHLRTASIRGKQLVLNGNWREVFQVDNGFPEATIQEKNLVLYVGNQEI